MSYESQDVLDAAVLIAPLVFFIAPNDPRLLSTLKKIMCAPAKGGLSVANMVSRYDHTKVDDGMFSSYAATFPTDSKSRDWWRRRRIRHGDFLAS
jgi:GH15 family glucan-1,4-alpha-glucosidase